MANLQYLIVAAEKHATSELEQEHAADASKFLVRYGAGHGQSGVFCDLGRMLLKELEQNDITVAIDNLTKRVGNLLENGRYRFCWIGVTEAGVIELFKKFIRALKSEFNKAQIDFPEIDISQILSKPRQIT